MTLGGESGYWIGLKYYVSKVNELRFALGEL